MKDYQLSIDQKYLLNDLTSNSDIVKALTMLISMQVQALEQEVLRYSLESGNERELALIKARSEGGKKLESMISRSLKQIRDKTPDTM